MAVVALVFGKPFSDVPRDLFIPPDAMEVLLESFTGPLDLLLYLIRKQNIDILDIPIAIITDQYMQYIELLENNRMELASDYLVMAALLTEIKSKLLLPLNSFESGDIEEDPRMALVRQLQTYEIFKEVSLDIDLLPRYLRDVFQVKIANDNELIKVKPPNIALTSLIAAMENLMKRQNHKEDHKIIREILSVRDKMTLLLNKLQNEKIFEFCEVLNPIEGRLGLVVTFLAVLELAKQSLLTITQRDIFSTIYLRAQNE